MRLWSPCRFPRLLNQSTSTWNSVDVRGMSDSWISPCQGLWKGTPLMWLTKHHLWRSQRADGGICVYFVFSNCVYALKYFEIIRTTKGFITVKLLNLFPTLNDLCSMSALNRCCLQFVKVLPAIVLWRWSGHNIGLYNFHILSNNNMPLLQRKWQVEFIS